MAGRREAEQVERPDVAAVRQLSPEERAEMAARAAASVAEHGGYGPPPPPTGAGAFTDLLFLPVHAAAAILGAGAQEAGKAVGWQDLVNAGKTVVMGDLELSRAVGEKPLAPVEIAAGTVLVATGIASSAGAGLIANGARELGGVLFNDKGRADVEGGPMPAAPGGRLQEPTHSASAQDAPPRRVGLFKRFAAWIAALLHHGGTQ